MRKKRFTPDQPEMTTGRIQGGTDKTGIDISTTWKITTYNAASPRRASTKARRTADAGLDWGLEDINSMLGAIEI